jgi:alpha,alpha-trehalase
VRASPSLRFRATRLAAACVLAAACRAGPATSETGGPPRPDPAGRYHPSRDLGALFAAVQLAAVFPDSKTFVDAQPLAAPAAIAAAFERERSEAGFDLAAFVARRFSPPAEPPAAPPADSARTMDAHLRALWPVLTRGPPAAPADVDAGHTSLVPLPRRYVVPGGRFREVYYWDSYFTMLGLVESGRTDLVRDMLGNFAWLIAEFGHIPNGNRTYYLSRSQPPFFAAMVGLYARATDTAQALPWLEALEHEHAFWMDGADRLAPGTAYRRVVRLPDGAVLNRYWDDRAEPRPEAYREDVAVAARVPPGRHATLFRDLRAAAESGWDFSSRWMRDPADLATLETTALVPVDLNAILYHTETLIAALRAFRARADDAAVARRYRDAADARRRALLGHAFDPDSGFFYDVRWRTVERVTDRPTLAAATPLTFGLATDAQADAVARRLERDFLRPGGFVTTLIASGQQWDAPNGWAPLQWMAIRGLRRYGHAALADTAGTRWLAANRAVWRATGRMMEKYDVVDLSRPAGGGEYPGQDGFGWTNGVALALISRR